MIVHTLKMCAGDAGPEQNLVLFILFLEHLVFIFNQWLSIRAFGRHVYI